MSVYVCMHVSCYSSCMFASAYLCLRSCVVVVVRVLVCARAKRACFLLCVLARVYIKIPSTITNIYTHTSTNTHVQTHTHARARAHTHTFSVVGSLMHAAHINTHKSIS